MKYADFISRFEKQTKTTRGVMVKCPAHQDGQASLSIGEGKDGGVVIKCFAGCQPGEVVGALGLSMRDLFAETPVRSFTPPKSPISQTRPPSEPSERPTIEKTYSYQDVFGKEVYQALRMKPKSFRQRHSVNGEWVWNMDGVERVLFNLPKVSKNQVVWLVEGEKDAESLIELGFCATCNVGGAGKWLDAYTESLAGKDVVLCGDNDEPGKKHMELVFDSVAGRVKSVKKISLPASVKDVSDYIKTFSSSEEAKKALLELADEAHPFLKGVKLPIYSVSELESGYARQVSTLDENSFSLSKWLPSLSVVRPLIPGELVFIIGDTGGGKTTILQNIARAALPLPTLLFELELPPSVLFERFVANRSGMTCKNVEASYRSGERLGEQLEVMFKNLFICTESRVSLADLENYIMRSELKIGERPRVVLIDYIQLMQAEGVNRREKVSDIAEGLKVLAKATQTIIICTSQVRRPDDESPELTLHSAKESGSIENSCGVLIGAWRDQEDSTALHISVLKATKGGSGTKVICNFDGATAKITERSRFTDEDVPKY